MILPDHFRLFIAFKVIKKTKFNFKELPKLYLICDN